MGAPAQVEEQFGEEPRVEAVIGLELDFDEDIGIVAGVHRDEQAVEPEGGLLDLFGTKFLGAGAARVQPGELQGDTGPVAKEFVDECVCFHPSRYSRHAFIPAMA